MFNRTIEYADDLRRPLVMERHLGHEIPLQFIRPDFQIEELKRLGWGDVHAYGASGSRKLSAADFGTNDEPWIYYHCRKAA